MNRFHPAAEQSVLGRWTCDPVDLTILNLIDNQVRRHPEKVAVRFRELHLTYRALNGKANHLAELLRERGVRKGDVVPVFVANSLELPIAWLALVKLGAVFVPFDLDWPPNIVAANLARIGSTTALVSPESTFSGADVTGKVTFSAGALDAHEPPHVRITPDDLIYGFFTSGSTGRPKCALNYHRGLYNRFRFMSNRLGHCNPKVVLQNSRPVFDSAVWQVLWTMAAGGEVVIPERVGHLDLVETIDLIGRQSVTMTDFVPSIFNALTEIIAVDPALTRKLSTLQQLLIGGEEINVDAVNRFRRLLPGVRLANVYGPTEASIGMVFQDIGDDDRNVIPLGLPIDNCFVAILDERLRPVPVGQVGEIYIGGDCLGAGYLGDPEKTREVFLDNPVPNLPVDRLYRTGDLGRIDQQRRFFFHGRQDAEVKVNGVRIELSEIERALRRHENVREAVVVAMDQPTGGRKKLCAFIVTAAEIPATSLRAHLATLLPEQMRPREFRFLSSIPLTPNGKADRQALIRSLRVTPGGRLATQGPLTEWERSLLALFRHTLGHHHFGADDDFFDAGGDSLSAVTLLSALNASSPAALRVSDIYQYPTVRKLAVRLEGGQSTGPDVDWDAESRLADSLVMPPRFRSARAPASPARILLTGATGFVGAHLLAKLLAEGHSQVFALVRGSDQAASLRRCHAALRSLRLWDSQYARRLSVIFGDLSKPRFGLTPQEWEALENEVDCIVHCGAMVDFLHSYSQHRPHNVAGTLEVLKLARSGKPIHFISTLSIFDASVHRSAAGPLILESDSPGVIDAARDGYGMSKAIAERLVRALGSRDLPVTIYRLGEVGPSLENGIFNGKSLLRLLLHGCARLGIYPAGSFHFDCTPVDSVANFVAHCVTTGRGVGETFHVLQSRPLSFLRVIDALGAAGIPLSPVSDREFWEALGCREPFPEAPMILKILQALLPEPSSRKVFLSRALTDLHQHFGRDRFVGLIEEGSIHFRELDEHVLSAMIAGPMLAGASAPSSE